MSASASSVKLAIATEAAFGVAEATGYELLRITSESLGLDVGNVQSAEIDATRQPSGNVRTSLSASGGISTELSLVAPAVIGNGTTVNGFDKLVEGSMHSTWSTIVAGSPEDIDITNFSAGTFDLEDTSTNSAFANVVVGQWIELTGFTTNVGAIYARVLTKTDSDNVSCEGVTFDGTAVQNETGDFGITLAGSHITLGNADKSYSIEREYDDLSPKEYSIYTGMRVNRWSHGLTPQAIFTQDFDFFGKLQATTQVASQHVATTLAKWSTPRLNAVDNFKMKMLGAFTAESSDRILEISWTLDNRLRTEPELGVLGSTDIGLSTPTLEGQIRIYMDDGVLIGLAEAGTLSKLAYRIESGNNVQIHTFPSVLFGRPDAPASGNDQGVIVTLPFFAEPDATNNLAFTVDRF